MFVEILFCYRPQPWSYRQIKTKKLLFFNLCFHYTYCKICKNCPRFANKSKKLPKSVQIYRFLDLIANLYHLRIDSIIVQNEQWKVFSSSYQGWQIFNMNNEIFLVNKPQNIQVTFYNKIILFCRTSLIIVKCQFC